ncbi:hypothetical protein [Pseudomonas aeruginosa]|uniref:hypothetical protein n=1 Tax=Pseudomonas aeruginosa TaxID=287 RepID=UPI00114F513E|nr:hypothetical protein [Pseudomonas aeruginosa]TQI51661.1 hypothetical protein FLI88_14695 [Pseudomonas aeruginosa]HBP5143732.1 hypothetical protein [Pseudomonas aeruginosa]HCG1239957.1 hypothetical protein [Pseudomonas aeruginosa]HEO1749395.1 hypothetical protein [Pseudomonas aeruginosa]
MNKANECSCPSGDGSLVHPCPAHPAVEQAGGDERDFQAKGAQEVPSPVSKEYDRHLISLLRKGEALPGHQEEAADEIERLRDWNDHLNNTVLPNILNPNFLMLMKGGERLLDLCTKDGKFIGVSLNDMKDVFDWMVTHARIAPDHAALAQPSPAQAEQAEVERLDWLSALLDVAVLQEALTSRDSDERMKNMDAGEVIRRAFGKLTEIRAQHERIVGALRTKADQLREALEWRKENQAGQRELLRSVTAERDAALARVAELEKQEPAGAPMPDEIHQMAFEEGQPAEDGDGYIFSAEEFDLFVQRLLDSCAAPVAQAQHSVPDGYALVPLEPTDDMLVAGQEAWTHKMERRGALEDCEEAGDVYRAMLAAAPGKEGL